MTPPPPLNKVEEEAPMTPKGTTFGRVIRKLTPRKSSMVNLLKGKGWKSSDDDICEGEEL